MLPGNAAGNAVLNQALVGLALGGEELLEHGGDFPGLHLHLRATEQLLDLAAHEPGAGEALVGVLGQRSEDDVVDGLRDLCQAAGRRHPTLGDLLHDEQLIVRPEQPSTSEHLPQDDARLEHVGARVYRAPEALLRRQVRVLAFDRAGHRLGDPLLGPGDTEVDELHLTVVGDHDVLRVDVPVHDLKRRPVVSPGLVSVVEPGQNLLQDP